MLQNGFLALLAHEALYSDMIAATSVFCNFEMREAVAWKGWGKGGYALASAGVVCSRPREDSIRGVM